jgi:hypothetical protein
VRVSVVKLIVAKVSPFNDWHECMMPKEIIWGVADYISVKRIAVAM